MIKVDYIKPFRINVVGAQWRLTFAYQYFAIIKDNERYNFIPIKGQEIIIDLNTKLVENTPDVFVFHRGEKYIRLPLYELLLTSNLKDHLFRLIDEPNTPIVNNDTREVVISKETEQLLQKMVQLNIKSEEDRLLATRDYDGLQKLKELKKELVRG